MKKKAFRSGLALIMALCMMFSVVGMSLAVEPEDVSADDVVAAAKTLVEKLTNYAEEINPNLKDSAKAYAKDVVEVVKSLAKVAEDKLQVKDLVVGIKADVEAMVAKAEELQPKAEELMDKAEVLQADAETLQADADALQADADALQAALDAAREDNDTAKIEELEAQAKELEAQADALQDRADALQVRADALQAEADALQAEYDALVNDDVEALKAKVEDLKAKLPEGSDAVYDSILDIYEIVKTLNDEGVDTAAVVEELKAAAVVTKDAVDVVLQNVLPEAEYTAVSEAANALLTVAEKVAAEGGLDANAAELQAAAAKVEEAVIAVSALLSEEDAAVLGELVDKLESKLDSAYLEHTSAPYHIDNDSYYVAMGDGAVVSDSYVDELAAELHHVDYKNLAEKGMLVGEVADVLAANSADVAKADLITLGFGHDALLQSAANMMGEPLDWTPYVGTEGAVYAEEAITALTEKVKSMELTSGGADITDTLIQFIESYAYACIAHVAQFPAAVNSIRAVNSDALIIVVGMYNPLNNVVLVNDEGEELLPIGKFMDALVEAANLYALGYAMAASADVIYVHAPDVETQNEKTNMTVWEIIRDAALMGDTNPSENGHVYIQEQILNALDVTGLWGDADENGTVEPNDATYVLEYWAGLRPADMIDLSVSDVDGYVGYEPNDATCILEYWAGLRQSFPVED